VKRKALNKFVGLRMDKDLYDFLERQSWQYGISVSALIRYLIYASGLLDRDKELIKGDVIVNEKVQL
jgi:hypothetical protein